MVNFIQMGDGADSIILSHHNTGAYIDRLFFGSSGLNQKPGIALEAGGSGQPWSASGNGQIDFKHDYNSIKTKGVKLFENSVAAAGRAGIEPDGVDWILPHQANGRIGELLGPGLGLDPSRFIGNFRTVGNLGSASICVALAEACETGQVRTGQSVLVAGSRGK